LSQAQNTNLDSLENVLKQQIADTSRVNILSKLASDFDDVDMDKSLDYATQLLTLTKTINHKQGQINAYEILARVYHAKTYSLDTIIATCDAGISVTNEINDTLRELRFLSVKALAYEQVGLTEKALSLQQQILKTAKRLNSKIKIMIALNSIGTLLVQIEKQQTAKGYYKKAIKYAEEIGNPRYIAYGKANLAGVYYTEKNYDSTLILLEYSLEYSQNANDNYGISIGLLNIGRVYLDKSQIKQSYEYLIKGYKVALDLNRTDVTTLALSFLSDNYFAQKKHSKSIEVAKEGLKLLDKGGNIHHQLDFYEDLTNNYETIQQFDSAFKYQKILHELNDSLFNTKKEEQINTLNIKYDVTQKESENKLLKAKTEIVQKTARNRAIIAAALVLALLFAIAWLALFYKSNQQKKELNEVLEEKVKKRTDELITANQELAKIQNIQLLETAKSRFFANISHEFRTPLTLIQAPVEYVLESNDLSNKNYMMLTKALQNSKHLKHLVGQILDLTKLEKGKIELHESKTLFYPLIRRLVANFETYAQQKGISLRFDYELNQKIQLEIDTDKFEKILNNYLSNAIKFTPKNGKIIVATKDLGNRIQLTVTDNGQGIPISELHQVFERYYQVKNSLTGVLLDNESQYTSGTGIGLSLCDDYAKLFNGKVWAESPNEDGKGSTFYFEFPKKEFFRALNSDEQITIEAKTVQFISPPIPIKNTTRNAAELILIVEDNYDLSDFLSEFLTSDYSIIIKENGQEALDWLASTKTFPNLILSDIMMPKVDGFELLEAIKNNDNYRHIPMMMLTARADVKDKLKALRIGVDDYLLKPFNATELKVRIKNIIENYNNRITTINTEEATDIQEGLKISEEDNLWLQKLEITIDANMGNLNLTADFIANKMYISRVQLFRKVKQLTGLTFNKYLNEIRLQKAKVFLETGKVSTIKTTAYLIGFKNAGYFSKLYNERFGKRPSEYFK
jgi:signal transduction histidine kinase/DNA-binding response OmpR family regulator